MPFPSTTLDYATIVSVISFLGLLIYDFTGPESGKDEHDVPIILYVLVGLCAASFLIAEPYWPLSNGAQGTFFQMVGLAAISGGAAGTGTGTTTTTTIGGAPLQVMGVVQDFYTHTTLGGTNAKVDILTPGVYTAALEQITVSTSTKLFTSVLQYSPGQALLLHISSTEGNGYYDAWYSVSVPSSAYLYSNTQFYWLNPVSAAPGSAFFLKNRAAALSFTLTNSTGSPVNTATQAAAGSTTAISQSGGVTLAAGSGYFIAQSYTPTLTLNIFSGTLSSEYGTPMPLITPSLAYVTRSLVLWMAVNNTAISAATIQGAGWILVPSYAVGYYTFYIPIPPLVSSVTTYGAWSLTTTLDASAIAAGKNVTVQFWVADLQNPADAASGIYDPAPTAKGASAQVSPSTLLPATGYIRTASGAPTGSWISCKFKTK